MDLVIAKDILQSLHVIINANLQELRGMQMPGLKPLSIFLM